MLVTLTLARKMLKFKANQTFLWVAYHFLGCHHTLKVFLGALIITRTSERHHGLGVALEDLSVEIWPHRIGQQ